jgi:hypothetical protein
MKQEQRKKKAVRNRSKVSYRIRSEQNLDKLK